MWQLESIWKPSRTSTVEKKGFVSGKPGNWSVGKTRRLQSVCLPRNKSQFVWKESSRELVCRWHDLQRMRATTPRGADTTTTNFVPLNVYLFDRIIFPTNTTALLRGMKIFENVPERIRITVDLDDISQRFCEHQKTATANVNVAALVKVSIVKGM